MVGAWDIQETDGISFKKMSKQATMRKCVVLQAGTGQLRTQKMTGTQLCQLLEETIDLRIKGHTAQEGARRRSLLADWTAK